MSASAFSRSARSGRLPFSKLSIESCRFLSSLRTTASALASSRTKSIPPFSIATFLRALLSMRITPSRSACFAFIASFRSWSIWAWKLMRARNVAEEEEPANFFAAALRDRKSLAGTRPRSLPSTTSNEYAHGSRVQRVHQQRQRHRSRRGRDHGRGIREDREFGGRGPRDAADRQGPG